MGTPRVAQRRLAQRRRRRCDCRRPPRRRSSTRRTTAACPPAPRPCSGVHPRRLCAVAPAESRSGGGDRRGWPPPPWSLPAAPAANRPRGRKLVGAVSPLAGERGTGAAREPCEGGRLGTTTASRAAAATQPPNPASPPHSPRANRGKAKVDRRSPRCSFLVACPRVPLSSCIQPLHSASSPARLLACASAPPRPPALRHARRVQRGWAPPLPAAAAESRKGWGTCS